MNTTPKEVVYRLCTICGDVYGVSGQVAFRLARQCQPTATPGVCPKHPRKHSEPGIESPQP